MQYFLAVARPSYLSPLNRWLISRSSSTITAAASATATAARTLFVGGLSFDTNEPILKDAFEHYGEIIEVKVICHHVTGMSKGYGFVNFTNELVATAALKEMNGKLLDGRNIRVEYARGRRARPAM